MRFKVVLITCFIILPFLLVPCSHAKPPKPGPNFIWVKPHTAPNGNSVPGHWKHTGPPQKRKAWVSGHRNSDGKWVPGHWKTLSPSKKGAQWVPGHHGPKGRWIPGHWR